MSSNGTCCNTWTHLYRHFIGYYLIYGSVARPYSCGTASTYHGTAIIRAANEL
jgi:hypothetical protein